MGADDSRRATRHGLQHRDHGRVARVDTARCRRRQSHRAAYHSVPGDLDRTFLLCVFRSPALAWLRRRGRSARAACRTHRHSLERCLGMIQLSPQRSQTMLAIHGWAGALLGLLLYVVIVTGLTSVFSKEIADWSNPWLGDAPAVLAAGTNRSLQAAAASIDPRFYEAVAVHPIAGDRLWAFFHRHEVDGDGFV